jgi:hypothetical protein
VEKPLQGPDGEGRTRAVLQIDPAGSLFAILGPPTADESRPSARVKSNADAPYRNDLTGPWQVRFTDRLDSPLEVTFEKLISWSEHPNEDIKYYSGTASYAIEFDVVPELVERMLPVFLMLGGVRDLVEVRLNGAHVETLWKPYFNVDITTALSVGHNKLELAVTNTWRNRLIGDYGKPESERKAFVVPRLRKGQEWLPGGPGAVLSPAGLLGPVFIVSGGVSAAESG